MKFPAIVDQVIQEHSHPLLFATMSGAHLYGFDSPDSDFDIRGCHILPAHEIVGLKKGVDTIDRTQIRDGAELDVVTHCAEKFFGLMLKKNGYVLEQLYSPLVLVGGPDHEALKKIAGRCITKHHVHHYLGFARNQWKLFGKESPPRIKPLLYSYRVLLTGIHLMRTGEVESNLPKLNETMNLSFIDELITRKREGCEKEKLQAADLTFHEGEYHRLLKNLEDAGSESTLPEFPTAADDLHEFLVELSLRTVR